MKVTSFNLLNYLFSSFSVGILLLALSMIYIAISFDPLVRLFLMMILAIAVRLLKLTIFIFIPCSVANLFF